MKPRQILETFVAFRRKSEPKSLVITRFVVTVLFFTILIGYTYVQIVDIRLDMPVFSVVQSRDEEKAIPMPTLHFTYEYPYTITCKIVSRATKISPEECLTHLQQPQSNYKGPYEGLFRADELNFTKSDIEKLEITIKLNNPNEILPDDLGVEIRIFDSHVQDPLDIKNYKETNPHVVEDLVSLTDLNFYHLSSQQYYMIGLSRVRRNVIEEKWWDILGIPPTFVDESYLNSELETHSYTSNDNSYTKVAFIMKSWRVSSEKEERAKTLFDTFGQISGVAGTLSIFYTFLFGAGPSAIQSWGIVQKFKIFGIKKGIKKHMNRRYPRLPFIHTSNEDNKNSSSIKINNDWDEIIERLDAVERFLKEYVVDADFLEQLEQLGIENENEKNKNISERI